MSIPPDPNAAPTNAPPAEAHPGMPPKDPPRFVCTACGETVVLETVTVPLGAAEILAFECGDCGTLHPYAKVSMRGRKLRDKLRALREERKAKLEAGGKYASHDPSYARLVAKERSALKAYKREVTRLDPERDRDLIEDVNET